jgi:hypothetical protein
LKIARNEVERLKYGWYCVRNRSTKEINEGVTIEQRHILEAAFFGRDMWKDLSKKRVGIRALKNFLAERLYGHVKDEFPYLIKDIEGLLEKCDSELQSMGDPRQTTSQQRRFLTHVATQYQDYVRRYLMGDYDADLADNDILKLRMHVKEFDEWFAKQMAIRGHSRPFYLVDGSVDRTYVVTSVTTEEFDTDIYDWIRKIYRNSRGAELPGTVNPLVVISLFRQQAKPWAAIADEYLESVEDAVDDFNRTLLGRIISDATLRQKINGLLNIRAQQALRNGKARLKQIVSEEMEGILQTVNERYAQALNRSRYERVLSRFKEQGLLEGPHPDKNYYVKLMKAAHLSNEDQAVYDIHDILKAYYEVAIKRFTDNVVNQVMERFYVGKESSVRMLSPDYVNSLSDEDLQGIAQENDDTMISRAEVESRRSRLQDALKYAKDSGFKVGKLDLFANN